MKSSVTGAEEDKIKIYVDDELLMEKSVDETRKSTGRCHQG